MNTHHISNVSNTVNSFYVSKILERFSKVTGKFYKIDIAW